MKRPVVSIIILCHRDRSYVRGCAASVRRHTRIPYELIFVDNASGDGVIEDLLKIKRASSVPVRIIRNRKNRFFAGGNNQGLRAARGRYLMLLNADTIVTPGWLSGLVACAERRPELGIIAPYTNHAAGLQVLWPPAYRSLEELPIWSRRWSRRNRGKVRVVPWLIAFCVLIPRGVLEAVGYLDDDFGPGGFEDYDFCLRVRLAGYECAIAEDVYVHHFGGRGYVNMRYNALRKDNREFYWSKWGAKLAERWGARPAVLGR